MGEFTRLFGAYPRVAVVEAFAENPQDELSVPDLVRITGKSKRAVYMHVEKLVREGILTEKRKEGKCQYYEFNKVDPRGSALVFLEHTLVLGDLESRIKRDEGIAFEMPFPYPRRFRPHLVSIAPEPELMKVKVDEYSQLTYQWQYQRLGMELEKEEPTFMISAATAPILQTLASEQKGMPQYLEEPTSQGMS